MSDRELLQAAAKAAGYELKWGEVFIVGDDKVDCTDLSYVVSGQPDEADWHWNPLDDDGDALRLAVKLRMDIVHFESGVRADVTAYDDCHEQNGNDPAAATRRAIVRAAAALAGDTGAES